MELKSGTQEENQDRGAAHAVLLRTSHSSEDAFGNRYSFLIKQIITQFMKVKPVSITNIICRRTNVLVVLFASQVRHCFKCFKYLFTLEQERGQQQGQGQERPHPHFLPHHPDSPAAATILLPE